MSFSEREVLEEFAEASGKGREWFDSDGYGREERTSRPEKARQLARLHYLALVRRREDAAKVAPAIHCGGCGKPLLKDAHKRGPRRRWCSARCYHRIYAQCRNEHPVRPTSCEGCAKPLSGESKRGPVKRFCSSACQVRALRARSAS